MREQATLRQFLRLLRPPLLVLLLVLVAGSFGFWLHWRPYGGDLVDALYMTFITVTTVGYGEVYPLDTGGRVLAIAVSLGGRSFPNPGPELELAAGDLPIVLGDASQIAALRALTESAG